jgi:hypothetical protein
MISVSGNGDASDAAALVRAALRRSVPRNLVRDGCDPDDGILCLVSTAPDADWPFGAGSVARKHLVFGHLPPRLVGLLRARPSSIELRSSAARAHLAEPGYPTASDYAVQYGSHGGSLGARQWRRAFERFDFADEWNNLGFGAIRADGSMWALASAICVHHEDELAAVVDSTGERVASYAALVDRPGLSVLWFNRPVGPIDSFEWRLVENFLSAHRAGELPAVPVLGEIPAGYDASIVARLDCDEDIDAARPLWAEYANRGIPLSFAVHTRLLEDGVSELLAEAGRQPGSVLSHSATHPSNWGGSYDAALAEAQQSADALIRATGQHPRYAVSPFHQSPAYAMAALGDAGYEGCIGGNIAADPAFNMARGGIIEGPRRHFVGQTQQCMLHGDCLSGFGDPIATYRQAFELACETRTAFAFLDHPFSARYQYGWVDEDSRIAIHGALLDHIQARAGAPLFWTAGRAMNFLRRRACVDLQQAGGGFRVSLPPNAPEGPEVAIEYRGLVQPALDGLILQ